MHAALCTTPRRQDQATTVLAWLLVIWLALRWHRQTRATDRGRRERALHPSSGVTARAVTLAPWMAVDVDSGQYVLVLDGKGDLVLRPVSDVAAALRAVEAAGEAALATAVAEQNLAGRYAAAQTAVDDFGKAKKQDFDQNKADMEAHIADAKANSILLNYWYRIRGKQGDDRAMYMSGRMRADDDVDDDGSNRWFRFAKESVPGGVW